MSAMADDGDYHNPSFMRLYPISTFIHPAHMQQNIFLIYRSNNNLNLVSAEQAKKVNRVEKRQFSPFDSVRVDWWWSLF